MSEYWAYMTRDSTHPSPQDWVTQDQSINFMTWLRLGLGLNLVLLALSMTVDSWPRFTEVWCKGKILMKIARIASLLQDMLMTSSPNGSNIMSQLSGSPNNAADYFQVKVNLMVYICI